MENVLKSDNIIALHRELDDFAKFHQQKGKEELKELILEWWNNTKTIPEDKSEKGQLLKEGFYTAVDNIFQIMNI